MRTIILIISLGVLLWAGSASAEKQKQYSVKVSIHRDVQPRMTKAEVESLLRRASNVLSRCNVRLRLDGKIQTFDSAPKDINNSTDLECSPSRACPYQGCPNNQLLYRTTPVCRMLFSTQYELP